jgi:hypothetical protein
MEEREPVAKEKALTPMSMIMIEMPRSRVFSPLISPYPTVVIVVKVKYSDVIYISV